MGLEKVRDELPCVFDRKPQRDSGKLHFRAERDGMQNAATGKGACLLAQLDGKGGGLLHTHTHTHTLATHALAEHTHTHTHTLATHALAENTHTHTHTHTRLRRLRDVQPTRSLTA